MPRNLIVSSPPYMRNGETAHCLMFDVLIALIPIAVASVYFYGIRAFLIIFISLVTAKVTEAAVQIVVHVKDFRFRTFFYSMMTSEHVTVMDGSAAVTGILLAFCLPPTVPFWLPVVGTFFAVAVGKLLFGGLGNNIFNPALAGRAFLLAAWPGLMTSWRSPLVRFGDRAVDAVDAVTSATPLSAMKLQGQATQIIDLVTGNVSGCIGETSAVAILLGAAYLLYKGTITWHIPFSYIATVCVMALATGQNPLFHVFAGGLMLGAFYMATDVVTTPVTARGRVVFGCGAGVLTMVIRLYGGYPEGVCYAILIMNAVTPLIDRCTLRRYAEHEIVIPLVDTLVQEKKKR